MKVARSQCLHRNGKKVARQPYIRHIRRMFLVPSSNRQKCRKPKREHTARSRDASAIGSASTNDGRSSLTGFTKTRAGGIPIPYHYGPSSGDCTGNHDARSHISGRRHLRQESVQLRNRRRGGVAWEVYTVANTWRTTAIDSNRTARNTHLLRQRLRAVVYPCDEPALLRFIHSSDSRPS